MFQAAAKTLSIASTSSVSRAILFSLRHYCKKTPTKLRVSEALSGAELGENVKVQVTLAPSFITQYYAMQKHVLVVATPISVLDF